MRIRKVLIAAETDAWWDKLSDKEKQEYIVKHPNSKYAKKHSEQEAGPDFKTQLKDIAIDEAKKEAGNQVRSLVNQGVQQVGKYAINAIIRGRQ